MFVGFKIIKLDGQERVRLELFQISGVLGSGPIGEDSEFSDDGFRVYLQNPGKPALGHPATDQLIDLGINVPALLKIIRTEGCGRELLAAGKAFEPCNVSSV